MFIDGEWCDAASGATVDATSPATGESLGPVAEGDRADARRAIAAANAAFPSWARAHRLRARRAAPPRGGRLRAPRGRAGARAHARPGQAAQGGGRGRGRRADRVLPHGRRGRQAPRRARSRERRAGPARAAAPPPARRARPDHALELALHDAGRGARAGARVRQHASSGRRRPRPRSARGCWPSASPRPTCRPGVFNFVLGPGPEVGDELAANPGTRAVAFTGSTETGLIGRARGPPARRSCSRWAATGRSW